MYSVLKFQAPFERLKDYISSPEVRLYKSILTQAIIDATNTSSSPQARAIERSAKNWIFGNGEDFQTVSYLANSEPTFIIKLTKEAIKLNHKNKQLGNETQENRILEKRLLIAV